MVDTNEVANEALDAQGEERVGLVRRVFRSIRSSLGICFTLSVSVSVVVSVIVVNTVQRRAFEEAIMAAVAREYVMPNDPPGAVPFQPLSPSATETPTPIPTIIPAVQHTEVRERWQSHLEAWEGQYGVPQDILWAIILVESGGKQYSESITRPIDGHRRYARGLFQVVDHWDRFSPAEDPFDPEINAREGIRYLKGCNAIIADGGENWTTDYILRYTFACYHAGANGNLNNADVQRYADNVLRLAKGTTPVRARAMIAPAPESAVENEAVVESDRAYNDCSFLPDRVCRSYSDWVHGWCSYHTRHRTAWVHPGETMNGCVENTSAYEFRDGWGK